MAKRIASLYAEIGADTRGLQQGVQRAKSSLSGLKETTGQAVSPLREMQGILTNIGVVAGVASAGLFAAKQAMDLAKEGASLEAASTKFDRLSDSINTTSEALMRDLREATRGMVSDAQLVQGAGDLMSLGLAKTHDQVVRLTRVAGALGMNMNQLVLTLTNQTTMRFDALNVAVDGFDERLQGLKATGMSTQDAFTEAFLQQAEEQLVKVGDVADTAAGAFLRWEAASANLADAWKKRLAPAGADLANILTANLTRQNEIIDGQSFLTMQVDGATRAFIQQQGALIDVTDKYNALKDEINSTSRREQIMAENAASTGEAVAEMGDKAAAAAGSVGQLNRELQSEPSSPLRAFIEDLEWYIAGGGKINAAFEELKAAVAAGLDPAVAKELSQALYVESQNMQVDLDNLSAEDAAENIANTLNISLEEAKALIDGSGGITDALARVGDIVTPLRFQFLYNGTPPPGWNGPTGSPSINAPGGGTGRGGGGTGPDIGMESATPGFASGGVYIDGIYIDGAGDPEAVASAVVAAIYDNVTTASRAGVAYAGV